MYRLGGSVGQGGQNAHDDVLLVQKQLNKNAHIVAEIGLVPETGTLDPLTQSAIVAFQRSIVRLSSPDGRIDPRGRTWRTLLGEVPHAATVAFTQLSAENANLYLYVNTDRVWGSPNTITSIRTLAEALKDPAIEIGVGDISFEQGGRMAPHGSHRRGLDVDIRPQRADATRGPITITDPNYSRERTRRVVEELQKDPNLELILFNDREISGVRFYEGHHNHLHIRFKS
ncbi:penicillin-insensitive murein endopeptidase [Chondromyces apiculatus]|uniref:Peptidoglycan-binding domain 1 n=1 Tax=Chondromyces apiculatus DSM 436 TaxID=1192034 RepID=A0A017T713_9BACT|nr:penicillin-insensitive murein endopeptidase [Chondromyces apiculatus]EYF04386.1 Peptidoglycan-binding domain 1 [Chondromyces apiculatus DSM 436]